MDAGRAKGRLTRFLEASRIKSGAGFFRKMRWRPEAAFCDGQHSGPPAGLLPMNVTINTET
jgi:hypothetical protein